MLRFFVLATLLGSTNAATSTASDDGELVTVQSPIEVSLAPGESKDLEIRVTVAEGFHVQANPAANEFLIPLELELESDEELDIGEVRYPPAETYRLKGTEEDLLTYDGTFAVSVSIGAPDSAASGTQNVRGRLHYQACDDRSCRRPATLAFELTAHIN